MNGKRSYVVQKGGAGRFNGKLKEILSSVARHKPEAKPPVDDSYLASVPLIKQSDNARLLPKYSSVLARSVDDGVNMDDLDLLQVDLEKLLSTSACRSRFFLSEIDNVDGVEDKDKKETKRFDKTPLKRKLPDEKPKFKDLKNGSRLIKKQYGLPVHINDHLRQEVPKVSLPKNDNSDKFWASIEPYCADVSKDDVAFLDNLIQEFSKEIDIKIPDIGDHYAHDWSEEIINDEQNIGRSPKAKTGHQNCNTDIKKNGLSGAVDTFATPHTQRLLAALIEEKVLASFPNLPEKIKASDINAMKNSNGPRLGICMDRKLRKELVEQGILNVEDLPKNMPDDEILSEIKKCQQELQTVNEYNLEELNKLRAVVSADLQKQEIKTELEKIDNQVLDLYNKILVAKKQAQQTEGDDFDRNVFTHQIAKEFEVHADTILKKQILLHTWAYPEYSGNDEYYYANMN